jgi:hypothetical protein
MLDDVLGGLRAERSPDIRWRNRSATQKPTVWRNGRDVIDRLT